MRVFAYDLYAEQVYVCDFSVFGQCVCVSASEEYVQTFVIEQTYSHGCVCSCVPCVDNQ